MTNQHSVTALSNLIEQLESDIDLYKISTSEALARAYAAGADQQLAEDAKWLDHHALNEAHLKTIPVGDLLKEAMRPKPPSLKEQALQALDLAALAESEPEGPTLDEIDDLCAEHSFCYEDSESLECLLLIITDALARWGK